MCIVGHKSHDPCVHKKYMEGGVMHDFCDHCITDKDNGNSLKVLSQTYNKISTKFPSYYSFCSSGGNFLLFIYASTTFSGAYLRATKIIS